MALRLNETFVPSVRINDPKVAVVSVHISDSAKQAYESWGIGWEGWGCRVEGEWTFADRTVLVSEWNFKDCLYSLDEDSQGQKCVLPCSSCWCSKYQYIITSTSKIKLSKSNGRVSKYQLYRRWILRPRRHFSAFLELYRNKQLSAMRCDAFSGEYAVYSMRCLKFSPFEENRRTKVRKIYKKSQNVSRCFPYLAVFQ